jgi:capsular exopolysaccharide synthesis family protein
MQEQYIPARVQLPVQNSQYQPDRTFVTHADIKRFIRRYSSTITWSAAIGVVLAGVYAFSAVPLYTAHAQIIIDPSLPQAVGEQRDGLFSIDNAQVESQIEVLRSESIAQAVINQLKLADDPGFTNSAPSILSYPFRLLAGHSAPDAESRELNAMMRYKGGLAVRRVGLSYSIDIQFSATSPEYAATIANATADAYIAEQINARAQAARQGGLWLEDRIDHLRKQMNAAAMEAQEFRAKRDYRLSTNRAGAATAPSVEPRANANETGRPNTLEELDSTAQTYRRIYESYLMAYTESVQKQSYPVSNARIITAATPPLSKSHPRTKLTLMFGALMGALAGLGIAFCRTKLDRSVSGARQIREEVGLECLASIPKILHHQPPSRLTRLTTGLAMARRPSDVLQLFIKGAKSTLRHLRAKLGDQAAAHALRPTSMGLDLAAVTTMPFSGFSLAMKRLKTAISLGARGRQLRCLAISSAMPGEGKTTIAANLATLFAASGVRTLLVDGDVRRATLSRLLAPQAELGLIEAMHGTSALADCVVRIESQGFDLLPISGLHQSATPEDAPAFGQAELLLEEMQKAYDFIIFEMPPLSASLDGVTMSAMVDATILVAEWGQTPVPMVSESVHLLRNAGAMIAGVVINKVDTSSPDYADLGGNYFSYTYTASATERAR